MKSILINALARFLFNASFWGALRNVVLNLSAQNLPGEDKKAIATENLKVINTEISNSLLNLGIELAVSLIKK